jgi:hypothetical protein
MKLQICFFPKITAAKLWKLMLLPELLTLRVKMFALEAQPTSGFN